MSRKAINWNELTKDSVAMRFWNQNVQQLWFPEDYNPANDKATWDLMDSNQKDVYKKALIKLTHLDTEQFGQGMPLLVLHTKNQHIASVFSYMQMMEAVHAKSYSNIFQSLITDSQEERDLYAWQESNQNLQGIAEIVVGMYHKLFDPKPSKKDLYLAMVASVFLESFLFYSGFFYPLYLAGNGKMINSAEIIWAIIRDESIHGVLVGLEAQNVYEELTYKEKQEVDVEVYELLNELYTHEAEFTKEVYEQVSLVDEVMEFVRYNANKALSNLGRPVFFENVKVNPIILNGIDTETKNHDFFSAKGNGYIRSTNLVSIGDSDFARLEALLGRSVV
ncbi:class 1b ribonucleoside-diphosphate reductase subunit beta [Paenibacillus odorifer]|uniref:class 1b ribonucleoside-diphosphate reductase subunit beta n=1 Tax=Paenibacillus odorifer TaxID=189426 RepID=UPI00096CA9F4|nr:class 1b ribonucleoside-diphosphate reductase subunit beta [Paenibacillus odorifer]OME54066.1 class 1b ribonucleoside-diphosphate reductase subunit beta [Paenibacillus odorifer]